MPLVSWAQSSYDPSTTETFTQATAAMSVVNSYTFGTNGGNSITNLQQLSASFNPYGLAGTTVINTEWERYQPFNSTNFVFQPTSLNLTATIPSNGGLFAGGIDSGQIWSQQTYQPGKTGQNVYAMSVRMKFPTGAGMWPGVWMDSQKNGDLSEIDIVEFEIMKYQNQYDWTGFDHGPGVGSAFYSLLTNPWVWDPGTDFSAAFHNYQVVWTPDATFKYFDDQLIYAQYFTWTAPGPANLGVNLAVGSNLASLPGLIPTSLSEFPSALQLESITVWGGPTAGPVTTTSSATYSGLDTTTQGTWTGIYGADGSTIANDTTTSLPSYASLTFNGVSTHIWDSSTTDPRALQVSSDSTNRIASTYYSGNPSFSMNLNLTDGNTHRVALYLLDWSNNGRSETISITDASTGTVLSTESFSNFDNGQYAIWNLKGNVLITVTVTSNGPLDNPLVSGIFFGAAGAAPTPTASASYSGLDTTTQGTWTGKYGANGAQIANDSSTSLPSYASLTFNGASTYTWDSSTTDPRALQVSSGSSSRIASTYYSDNQSFSMNLNLTDGNTHRVALYLLDWSDNGRSETISILDAGTGKILSTESFTDFDNGQYATWEIKGNVIITVTVTSDGVLDNPLVGAIFFG